MHDAAAAHDVVKICPIYMQRQSSQRFGDCAHNGIVRTSPHAARCKTPVLQGLHQDTCVRVR